LPGITFNFPGDTVGTPIDWNFTIPGVVGTLVNNVTIVPPDISPLLNAMINHPNYNDGPTVTPLAVFIEPVLHSWHPTLDDWGRQVSIYASAVFIEYTGLVGP
jgi:hypothetical protein